MVVEKKASVNFEKKKKFLNNKKGRNNIRLRRVINGEKSMANYIKKGGLFH